MQDNNRRMNIRQNRKKKNKILNILIGIVLLLIIIVVVNIVTDDNTEEAAVEQEVSDTLETEDDSAEVDLDEDQEEESSTNESNTQNEPSNSTSEEDKTTETSENTTTEQQSSSNSQDVNATVDPSWEPIGTTQTGEHVSSYDSSSVDWAEKVEALAYAAGLEPSNMYVKFLGNGGSPQKSIGTVTSKDGKEIYRISLEWVDGQGWKPTKREKLTTLEDAS